MKFSFISFMLSLLMMIIYLLLSKKHNFYNNNKMNPFECGFDPIMNNRMSFSIRFFKITLIFLIFDIEIILMLPSTIMWINSLLFFISINLLSLIIIMGLFYEWMFGSLNWIK
uniref:NADH dehydrogenase subunit 3 n=1 Tax=Uroobovella oviformis TaxID=3106009 RepID=UPI002E76B32D|nr:NADH dehydrogenase subunit 3 [Uroobovella oviformis]WPV72075.1 NADH dehydrogenase subunit 3 [Uroobovella oviformis]